MNRKSQVVMLPTNSNRNQIWLREDGSHIQYKSSPHAGVSAYRPQHLYIFSDDEIKEEDYGLYSNENGVLQFGKYVGDRSFILFDEKHTHYPYIDLSKIKKVIGTTNPMSRHHKSIYTLETKFIREERGPASISSDFIQAYIKVYNEGKPITECMVEYEEKVLDYILYSDIPLKTIQIPKLRQPENSLIIHPVKEKMYTEVEVALIAARFAKHCSILELRSLKDCAIVWPKWWQVNK